MNLLDLPNEILVSIVQRLNLKSKISVASTCERLSGVLCRSDVVGSVSFSRTAFPVQILQHDTFRILAPHIRQLELSDVSNLDKSWLVPTLKLMRSLRDLDLSLTNIDLLDLAEVCEQCPDLTRLSVNYSRPYSDVPQFDNLEALKKSFRRLEYLHLFGGVNGFQSLDAMRLLQDSNLNEVKLTITYVIGGNFDWNLESSTINELPFKTFSAFMNEGLNGIPLYYITFIDKLCTSGWEFVVIQSSILEGTQVTVSPEFHRAYTTFDSVKFSYVVSQDLDWLEICGNTYIFMWHPDVAINNSNFHNTIMNNVHMKRTQLICKPEYPPPVESILICQDNFKEYDGHYSDDRVPSRHPEHYSILNIDRIPKFGDDLKLSFIQMNCHNITRNIYPLTLGPNTEIYKRIVYLYFGAGMQNYISSEFLSALFQHCTRLETLFYDNNATLLEKSLPHSKSLKNLMVYDTINKPLSFVQAVAKCRTLENIHICDGSFSDEHMEDFTEGLSELVESCTRLYNLEYHAAWFRLPRETQLLSIIKVLQNTGRDMRYALSFYDENPNGYEGLRYRADDYRSIIQIDPHCQVFLRANWFKYIGNEHLKYAN